MRCNPFADSKKEQEGNHLSAVRLQISVNEIKCCRKIALKGLYGEQARLQDFLIAFKNKLHDQVVALSSG
jgi:metal-responsive CopG/Arc/MetJ family transcriptional regulator